MKLNNFRAEGAIIQKHEQVKIKNLLRGDKNYLLSFKKLSRLRPLIPYTRLEPLIKSGRTMYTLKPMLGRTYRSVRFVLDSIKEKKLAFGRKLKGVLSDTSEAHFLKKKFQGELLEARLNFRIRRKRKKYIKKQYSYAKPPHWFKFKTKRHKLKWIKKAKLTNLSKILKKTTLKLAFRYFRLKRIILDRNLFFVKKYQNRRWLAMYNLRFNNK